MFELKTDESKFFNYYSCVYACIPYVLVEIMRNFFFLKLIIEIENQKKYYSNILSHILIMMLLLKIVYSMSLIIFRIWRTVRKSGLFQFFRLYAVATATVMVVFNVRSFSATKFGSKNKRFGFFSIR